MRIAGPGVHDNTGRLVDDDQMLVFVHDIQGQGLRAPADFRLEGRCERERRTGLNGGALTRRRAVETKDSRANPFLQFRPGEIRKKTRGRLIQADAIELRADYRREVDPLRSRVIPCRFVHHNGYA